MYVKRVKQGGKWSLHSQKFQTFCIYLWNEMLLLNTLPGMQSRQRGCYVQTVNPRPSGSSCSVPPPHSFPQFPSYTGVLFHFKELKAVLSPMNESECFILVMHNCLYLWNRGCDSLADFVCLSLTQCEWQKTGVVLCLSPSTPPFLFSLSLLVGDLRSLRKKTNFRYLKKKSSNSHLICKPSLTQVTHLQLRSF